MERRRSGSHCSALKIWRSWASPRWFAICLASIAEFRKLKASIRERRPDVAILIDFPDIHFQAGPSNFTDLGIPVIFFVSPQLWAWKKASHQAGAEVRRQDAGDLSL